MVTRTLDSYARKAQSHVLFEDYVEIIADLLQTTREARTTDIARRFGVSHSTAIKNIARIKSVGLMESHPYRGVFLIEEGERLAHKVRRRHQIVVDLLVCLVECRRKPSSWTAKGLNIIFLTPLWPCLSSS